MSKSQTLEEKKATGEDSQNMEPVAPEGGNPKGKNRKADLNKSVDPKADNIEDTVKTPQGNNDVGLKEEFVGLFGENNDLSEEFKEKMFTVFEAAVNDKANAVIEERVAEFEEKAEAELSEAVDDLTEKVNGYLKAVVERWLEDNEVAIESNIKVQVAESIISGVKTLVSEHNMEIDDETFDVVSEMEEKLEESVNARNELSEEMIALKEEKETLEREIKFIEVSEDLTDTQTEKLKSLSEGMTFESTEDYTNKLSVIKEGFLVENVAPKTEDVQILEEEVVQEESKQKSPYQSVNRYAADISRIMR